LIRRLRATSGWHSVGVPGVGASVALRRYRWVGFVGSLLLAVGGLTAGALPARAVGPLPGLDQLHRREGAGLVCVYAGITVLVAAWWRLGQAVRGGRLSSVRGLNTTLGIWAAPLLLAPPLFSRDVCSYLAQGAMIGARIDVYKFGPAALGGPLAAGVPPAWQHTPAPYGPVFLSAASAVAGLASPHILAGLFGMRLLALLALGLLIAVLPGLARSCGVEPARALWLAGLNPLVLLHLVAGAHNDALMLALLVAGLAAAMSGRPVLGALLITLGSLVKVPAMLGLLVVVAMWSQSLTGRARVLRAALGAGAVAVATTVSVTAATGIGYGWLGVLGTPVSAPSWSLTSALGRITRLVLAAGGLDWAPLALPAWRWAGMVAAGVTCLLVWRYRHRFGPVYALGLMLTAVATFGPAIRPWYLLWGVVPVAVAAPDGRVRRWAQAGCAVLTFAVPPSGFGPTAPRLALGAIGVLLAGLVLGGGYWARGYWARSARLREWLAASRPAEPEPELSA
jgi:hypothetical protein